jgi:hypothetical protein
MREVITPKGSRFILCQLSKNEPAFPRYPPQPVVRCDGYQSREGKERESQDESVQQMLPLYQDPWFTFRFADDRLIPRFHLEGVEAGQRVSVFKIDPGTGERLRLLATATVGDGGWVDLPEPIIVRTGDAFVAVPHQEG